MLRLSNFQKEMLLEVARATVEERLGLREPLASPGIASFQPFRCGVFVSIHKHGALRGCIGRVETDDALPVATAECAVAAALEDPRFLPLRGEELDEVVFEVSVLSPLEPLQDLDRIEVGRHGLLIEHGTCRGLLLPQVALQYGWNRSEFLSQTSVKAGLAPDAWRGGVSVFVFESLVFSEETP